MAGMDDLVVWLRVQLDDDERLAQEWLDDTTSSWWWDNADPASAAERVIVRNSPRQLLAEVDAKRRLMKVHQRRDAAVGPGWSGMPDCIGCGYDQREEPATPDINDCPVLRLLALPYADRPGYREEWRPEQ